VILRIERELKKYTPLKLVQDAAIQLQDFAIENVGEWAGTVDNLGRSIWVEMVDEEGKLKVPYRQAAIELSVSSNARCDPDLMIRVLGRMAACTWFIRCAYKKYENDV